MERKELTNIIDEILKPLGFTKKGNYWRLEGEELFKIVNLQKSSYSNKYYINYGFDIKNLNYDSLSMHIFRGISTEDSEDRDILDFEKDLNSRIEKIKWLVTKVLLPNLNEINSLSDLINDLKKQPHLNDIPIKIKEFLGLK